MAELTGGELVARVLAEAGVGHVFTLCGGHVLPIYDGCVTEGIQVVDLRHEQAAAHAAAPDQDDRRLRGGLWDEIPFQFPHRRYQTACA